MAVLFESLEAGLVLYDCSKERMGNLTVQVLKVRSIRVLEVNAMAQRALISWNGNPPAWKSSGFFKSPNIRKSPPEWINRVGKDPACYFCHKTQAEGHAEGCQHPKALRHADPPNV